MIPILSQSRSRRRSVVTGGGDPVPDYILRWTMDDADISGTTITDRGSGGHNGTLVNSPGSVAGKIAEARSFTGTQYISSSAVAGTDYVSCFAWVKRATTPGSFEYLCNMNNNWYMACGGGAWSNIALWRSDGSVTNPLTAMPFSNNVWGHCGFTYDGLYLRIYANGSQVSAISFPGTARKNVVAITASDATYHFYGYIDDLRVYDRALSSTEVNDLYNFT